MKVADRSPQRCVILGPSLSLIVAVVLIQDYVLTIVVSTLSGSDQLLSIIGGYSVHWFWHFLIGASMAMVIWYLTIRGRGESAQIVFTLLSIFLDLLSSCWLVDPCLQSWCSTSP